MSQGSNKDVLKSIPSVDKMLNWTEIKELLPICLSGQGG